MKYKLIPSITLALLTSSNICFAQNNQAKYSTVHPFPSDSLVGTWENCATEFDKKIKSRNTETTETVQLTGNTCPEINFDKGSTGSVRTTGTNQPPYITFCWQVRGSTLYISSLIKSQDYNSNYLSNGQYTITRRHFPKGKYTQIVLIDNKKLRYILLK